MFTFITCREWLNDESVFVRNNLSVRVDLIELMYKKLGLCFIEMHDHTFQISDIDWKNLMDFVNAKDSSV